MCLPRSMRPNPLLLATARKSRKNARTGVNRKVSAWCWCVRTERPLCCNGQFCPIVIRGMQILAGVLLGWLAWFLVRVVLLGTSTVNQNERAVKTIFGQAERLPGNTTTLDDPISAGLRDDEKARYAYPQVRVIQPGGPYFRFPWERVYKVTIATNTVNMALDPETPEANEGGTR